jgi:hypothetical protein
MDNIYANKKVENGNILLPQMYGDPRGYKHNGPPSWYHYTNNLFEDRLTEIYLWSMNRKDLERVPKEDWIAFLEGQDKDYPVKALRADLEHVRRRVEAIRNDITTPDTRLADYLLGITPAATDALTKLTLGGYFARGRIWTLHSRFRYFDAERRRAGLPQDVGALVEKLTPDSATVTLVNLNAIESRTVTVQAGAYGEHHFDDVTMNGQTSRIDGRSATMRLDPGCGAQLTFRMTRYKHQPSLAFPF